MSAFLAKLERQIGPYAIPNLSLYLIAGQGIFFVVGTARPDLFAQMQLVPQLVLEGQVWRLLTFIFVPQTTSILWLAIGLYVFWLMGSALESRWGAFRYNLFLGIGFAATVLVSFAFPAFPATNWYVLETVFLAFALLWPEFEFLLFFVLPVKVKYLAWLTWGLLAYQFYVGPMPMRGYIAAALSNYILFFGPELLEALKRAVGNSKRRAEWKKKTQDAERDRNDDER